MIFSFGETKQKHVKKLLRAYEVGDVSLVLQIPCEVRWLGNQNPLQNHLQKGLEHQGLLVWVCLKGGSRFFVFHALWNVNQLDLVEGFSFGG